MKQNSQGLPDVRRDAASWDVEICNGYKGHGAGRQKSGGVSGQERGGAQNLDASLHPIAKAISLHL